MKPSVSGFHARVRFRDYIRFLLHERAGWGEPAMVSYKLVGTFEDVLAIRVELCYVAAFFASAPVLFKNCFDFCTLNTPLML
jgi:hypothetical protein